MLQLQRSYYNKNSSNVIVFCEVSSLLNKWCYYGKGLFTHPIHYWKLLL